LFHDLGKATTYFQSYLQGRDAPQDLRRHAELGALWLLELVSAKIEQGESLSVIEGALAVLFVRRHHGRLDDLADGLTDVQAHHRNLLVQQLAGMNCEEVQQWVAAELTDVVVAPQLDRSNTKMRVQLLLELKKHCSNDAAMRRFQQALVAFGQLIEADRDSAAGYSIGAFCSPPRFRSEHVARFRQLLMTSASQDERIASARNRIYDAAVASAEAQPIDQGALWTLTVPTGSGKTLAAIGWAIKRREMRVQSGRPSCPIIYALPFTSIIDQNADVIRRLWPASSTDESLLAVHHHLAELGDLARSGEASLARSWVEGWRADIVTTTFVQVSNALFHGTHADSRRFAGLAGAILILDEVQAIPAELWPVFRTALRSLSLLFGTDILLVTATQPALFGATERVEIGPSDLPTEVAQGFDRYDLHADIANPTTLTSVVKRIIEELRRDGGRSCLVILNTIREALNLHELVRTEPSLRHCRLFHLSTNLRPKDRKRILAEVSALRASHILVATQVVEAGVDLTFDVVLRAMAPLDSIIQAAGRCNRHGVGARGRVIVFDPEENSAKTIYGSLHISLTRQLLEKSTASKSDAWLAEPKLTDLVVEYFQRLGERIQNDEAARVHDAVRQLQFAALRGEGVDQDRDLKCVQLIEDQNDRIPHFIETDDSDVATWNSLVEALAIEDVWMRRTKLRSLRNEVGQRIVEVPQRFRFDGASVDRTIVRVPSAVSSQWYSLETGWKR
jgi:CRISPR-associated endonuclease/helicase Cas3